MTVLMKDWIRSSAVTSNSFRVSSTPTMRLRWWLRHKHKIRCCGYRYYPDSYLYETLRLVRLSRLGCDVSWVTLLSSGQITQIAVNEKPHQGATPAGSISGCRPGGLT